MSFIPDLKNAIPLEKRVFKSVCLIMFVLMSYLGGQALWLFGITPLSIIEILMALLGVLFLLLSNKGYFHRLRWILITILICCCPYFWVSLGGYYGSMRVGIIMVGIIVVLLSSKNRKFTLFIFFYVLVVTLHLIQYHYPEVIVKSNLNIENAFFNNIVYVTAILYVMLLTKSEYDKERNRTDKKNEDLISLNHSLAESNEELKITLDKLTATQSQLIESEKMASVGRMTSGLAHELNNPLNYVSGGIIPILNNIVEIKSLLDESTFKKASASFEELEILLKHVGEGSSKISSVIDNLVRVSAGQQGKGYQKFDFSYFLEELISTYSKGHPEIELIKDIQPALIVKGQALEIIQAIKVILDNALEAKRGNTQTKISVSLKSSENAALLTIGNNGADIEKAVVDHIFDPFFTTKTDQKHLGLGLYFAYGVIKRHGGSITYQRKSEETYFMLNVPLC
ncbi:MAG: HAMP domain-containing histidine kinase [Cyclobacteriaceae bacterium]